ncbi:MAG: flagellin [Pseudomonadota bacterium]|nr:flagellin [Pseudomonadota bacterium]
MGFSVHSMAGTNAALQHIDRLTRDTLEVQTRIATGLKVGSAKDNGTIWAMAQGMRASNGGRVTAMRSIDAASGVVEVALAAANGISDIMIEMKSKLLAATDTSLDETTWRNLMGEYVALGNEMTRLVEAASFNGINLLEAGANDLSVVTGPQPGDTMTIAAEDMTDGGGIVDVALAGTLPYPDTTHILTQPDQAMINTFDSSMSDVNAAVSRLGTSLRTLEVQKVLLQKQSDVTEASIGHLVDADLGEESAKLNAMMVRQQLGVQALSIANEAPRMILGFFR